MHDIFIKQGFGPLMAGAVVGGLLMFSLLNNGWPLNSLPTQHTITDPYDSEYHVHADFHIVVNDTLVDLSEDVFMTSNEQHLHDGAHLHDNNSDVKHIHAEEVTFADFLASLQITLTDSCLTLDNEYCSGEAKELLLYVNNNLYASPLTQYVPVDSDRILLYFGEAASPQLATYLENIPDDACYYSGTCPERGVAPAESCGLTCEL